MDYNRHNAQAAWEYLTKRSPEVLVVGANTGKDCSYFVEFGAKSVVGLDVIDEVGSEFSHPKVTYLHESAEAMTSIADESFDLVYCYATMEHVPNIEAAFAEMARVVKKGGIIYSLAAPLWRSPIGHHMGEFTASPWIHLVKSEEEIVEYAIQNNLFTTSKRARDVVAYMLNPTFFNMRPSSQYTAACEKLSGLQFVHNEILNEDRRLLDHPNAKAALARGIPEADLLGITHRLVAAKLLDDGRMPIRNTGGIRIVARLKKKVRSIF
ncbi:class I SAM-dependent methyltransferase [Rhizobium changzhiense]|uniref:class I SAM-dependent methyltransferase n=1 Tax=Rhizobium changzhiense TaxID=2692317 RepID=UPI001F0BFD78|nr:class I SAM-dependent methyltransferase [Rhizobium changzhiense]MCH4548260.1 class I SAM-dependent methyltransferase [Rhizobium changzhiense]